METNFKGILDKFKQGANSMEEVYSDLSYLTSNYDKEIEKLQRTLEDERARANNEEHIRKEAEANLADLKALQQINFSVIVNELINKPKEEFSQELKKSLRKFTFSIIIIAILSSIASIAASYTYLTLINPTKPIEQTAKIDNTKQLTQILNEIKKENNELKIFIKENMKPVIIKEQTVIPSLELKKDETKRIDNQKAELSLINKEEFLEKVLAVLENYDKRFKLNSKNDSRILYKMFMLDLAPFKYELFLQELKLFAKKDTYIPTIEEIKIWDNQMLLIYTKMLRAYKNTPKEKRADNIREFNIYKENDATQYQGWEYIGEEGESIEETLEKEIEKLNAQIVLNDK